MSEETQNPRVMEVEFEMHASFRMFSDNSMIIWQDEDHAVKLSTVEVAMLRAYFDHVDTVRRERRFASEE